MARKRKYHEHHEEHQDEAWLLPYADLLTLLLALFIVLFASSQVDQKKFEQMAYSLNMAFSGSPSVFDKNESIIEQSQSQNKQEEGKQQAYLQETVQLLEAKKNIDAYIQTNQLAGQFSTVLTEDGLMVRIRDSAIFPSGSATLLPDIQRYGKDIAALLATLPQKVVISGHTDTMPIHTAEFPSNWQLSSSRALNFMLFILGQNEQLHPGRFSAIGFGEYRPVAANQTEQDRAQNRRVEILIMRNQH